MRVRHQAAQVQTQAYAAGAALAGGVWPEKRLTQLRRVEDSTEAFHQVWLEQQADSTDYSLQFQELLAPVFIDL